MYIATGEDIYKAEAERFYKCPILFLSDFLESGNVFIWERLQVMVFGNYLYIFDESDNYVSISIKSWSATNIYVNDIDEFNTTWHLVHRIFAELCVGDIVIDYSIASRYVKIEGVFLPIRSKCALYKNGKITRLCLK